MPSIAVQIQTAAIFPVPRAPLFRPTTPQVRYGIAPTASLYGPVHPPLAAPLKRALETLLLQPAARGNPRSPTNDFQSQRVLPLSPHRTPGKPATARQMIFNRSAFFRCHLIARQENQQR